MRRYERQFLVFWVGQVRWFRLEKHLTQEVLAFVRTFAQLVETARFQEAPDAHEITQLPGESRRARAPGGP